MWDHGIGNNRRPTVSLARRRDQIERGHAGGERERERERGWEEGGRSEQGGRPFGADPSHSLLGGYLLIVLAP